MNINIAKKSLGDVTILAKEAVKKANLTSAQVVVAFDVSGSMRRMYRDRIVQQLATLVLGLALHLDDNGSIPVYAFDEGCTHVGELNEDNLTDFVDNEIVPLVGGGTNYTPIINKIVEDAGEGDEMLVLLFTDGDNAYSDRTSAKEALIKSSNLPIFFQWFGIYQDVEEDFAFLHKMDELKGRKVDNAGFAPLGLTLTASGDTSDQLYDAMLHEFKDYPAKAKQAGVTWENKKKRRGLFGLFS